MLRMGYLRAGSLGTMPHRSDGNKTRLNGS